MDPELLKALTDAGMAPEQLRMLAPQLQLGQEMMQPHPAQGREVGSGPFRTFVASSPLEHLANAMQEGAGAYITKKTLAQQQDLLAKQRQARQSVLEGLTAAQMGGQGGTLGAPAGGAPYDQFAGATPNGGGPTRAPDQRAAQALMTAMAGSGDQPLQAAAHFGMQAPLEQEKVNASRLEQVMEKEKLRQMGPQPELGGQTPNVFEMLTKRKMASQIGINPITGQPYQKTGGGGGPAAPGIAGPGGGGGESPPLYDKRLDPMLKSLRDDLDASISRGGVMKGNQERLNAAQRLLTLAVDPLTGGPANLTPQQMSEVSTSLATLIGGGGSSEGSRHELTPYTKGRTMAEVMQWLSDKPQGADQQAFVKQMIDTARREQSTAENAIRTAQAQRLPLHNQLFGLFPKQAQDALSAYGFEPGTVDLGTGKYTPKAKPPPGGGGGGTARVKYRDQLLDIPRARLPEALKDGAVEVPQ